MRKVDPVGQADGNCAFMLNHPRMEQAIAELVKFAARVGVSRWDLVQMLDAGMNIPDILRVLDDKSASRIQ